MTRNQIDELAKAERREYHKAWRAANRDKVQKNNADYWRRKAEQRLRRNGGNANGSQNVND